MANDGQFAEEAGIRAARPEDAGPVAAILAAAFPALYRSTFGRLSTGEIARLLTALYQAGILSLENSRVCERNGVVLGVVTMHLGQPIGRGTSASYWHVLRSHLGPMRALRAFVGGLSTNSFLNSRIPHAADLAYIEALAVTASARRQGIGFRLLTDAAGWALDRKRRRLALHVLQTNVDARRLYERFGFRPWSPCAVPRSTRTGASSWSALLLEYPLVDAPSSTDARQRSRGRAT